jgi:NAD(P)-dependent dehydrogenase (short-subunit alcohol dehydrogenase family)
MDKQEQMEKQPIALVTGASAGIGKAIADELVQAGYHVVGTSRKPQHAQFPNGVEPLLLDAARPAQRRAFIAEHQQLFAQLDLLVNNAGSAVFGDFTEVPEADISMQLQLLLHAPIDFTRASLPSMRARGHGTIVNVSSLAARFPLPYLPAYCAAKAGLTAFTRNLQLTEPKDGVRFIDFQPGDYRTAFNQSMRRIDYSQQRQSAAWEALEKHMAAAPPAAHAARCLMQALRTGRYGTLRGGGWFQRSLAPLAARLLTSAALIRLVRRYYHLQ